MPLSPSPIALPPSLPPVSPIKRLNRTEPIRASYLDPENAIWYPHWHGVTTDEERVQQAAALQQGCLDWYKMHVHEAFKRLRNLKHVRQLVLSRISQLQMCMLKQVREPRKRKVRALVLDDIEGPRNLKSTKCGQHRVLVLTYIIQGRACINLRHV